MVPSFRSPPGVPGVARTLRRRPDGSVQVAVTMAERPWAAVQADLVEGFVVANRLAGPDGRRPAPAPVERHSRARADQQGGPPSVSAPPWPNWQRQAA